MKNLERKVHESDKKQRLIHLGKRVQQIGHEDTELELNIFQGFLIDEKSLTQLYDSPEYYRVMVWTEEETEYGTQGFRSFYGVLCFNQKLMIPLNFPTNRYLYIELVRGLSWKDPGTSYGTNVMGRAKVKVPSYSNGRELFFKVELVGLNSDRCLVSKGYLDLSMKIHRYPIL